MQQLSEISRKKASERMTHTNSSELENLLSAVTDALLADEDDLDTIIAQYDVPRASVDRLVSMIRRLHVMLVGVQPSQRYVQRLKHDLVGTSGQGIVARVRYLPPRIQITAGIAVVAGFMLLSRRRLIDDARKGHEAPALQ
jgi:hypothetical protein